MVIGNSCFSLDFKTFLLDVDSQCNYYSISAEAVDRVNFSLVYFNNLIGNIPVYFLKTSHKHEQIESRHHVFYKSIISTCWFANLVFRMRIIVVNHITVSSQYCNCSLVYGRRLDSEVFKRHNMRTWQITQIMLNDEKAKIKEDIETS